MKPSRMLTEALNAQPRDMYDIVGALEGYLGADPQFKTSDFEDAIQYVLSHGVSSAELYQKFDPELEFREDESQWNYDYYLLARVHLKANFCRKRIEHVKSIAGKLYPASASASSGRSSEPKGGQQSPGKKPKRPQESVENPQSIQEPAEKPITQKAHSAGKVGAAVIVVLIIVVIVAIIIKK